MDNFHILESIFITAFKLITTKFLREKCMSKINIKETKPKKIKSMIPKLLKTLNMKQFLVSWSFDFIYRDHN